MSEAIKTTDHQEIRKWAEQRGGFPATVRATQDNKGPGVLRIDFDEGEPDDALERIDWDNFFQKFDAENLAFLYQDETKGGATSRFCKLVERDTSE